MKKILGINPKTDSLVPVELSLDGLKAFPQRAGQKAWWVKRTSVRPPIGRLSKNDQCIKIWWQGLKATQVWHKSYFVQKINL